MGAIHGKLLFDHLQDIESLKNLIKRWSFPCRYVYKGLSEGMNLNTLRKAFQETFNLSARYAPPVIAKVQFYKSMEVKNNE